MKTKLGYLYNIGDKIIDDINDIVIVDRTCEIQEYFKKDGHINRCTVNKYKCFCYKCNVDFWINESTLIKGAKNKCPCCSGRSVFAGINDVATLKPELIPYFVNLSDAKKYSLHSDKKVFVKCPICGYIKLMRIANLVNRGFSCNKCSDNISYPNKFMLNLLSQLNVEFEAEKKFGWCKFMLKSKEKFGIYDFYIPSLNIIIEMDGGTHFRNHRNLKVEDLQYIDKEKDRLAFENNISIIRINCDYDDVVSRFAFIKNNVILNLNKIFDLKNINWTEIDKKSCSNFLLEACRIKNENPNVSNVDLANCFCVHPNTIIRWLDVGNQLGLCTYSKKQLVARPIICLNNGMIFNSAKRLQEESLNIFGVRLYRNSILDVCNDKKSVYKGYSFAFYDE